MRRDTGAVLASVGEVRFTRAEPFASGRRLESRLARKVISRLQNWSVETITCFLRRLTFVLSHFRKLHCNVDVRCCHRWHSSFPLAKQNSHLRDKCDELTRNWQNILCKLWESLFLKVKFLFLLVYPNTSFDTHNPKIDQYHLLYNVERNYVIYIHLRNIFWHDFSYLTYKILIAW